MPARAAAFEAEAVAAVDAPARPPAASRRRRWVALVALVAVPLAAHLTLSSFGFNPTDDGFILSASRRLIDGQVPHRDFISIRPAGSALLHLPEALLGGAATFWVARLVVWLELALIAWAWTMLAQRFRGHPARAPETLLVFEAAWVLGVNTFPVMPWHTVDALALASAGLLLASDDRPRPKLTGYALLGAAMLCRQNFLPVAPLCALALGDRRRNSAAFAIAAPLAGYAAWLLAAGAAGAAMLQMGSQSGLREAGIDSFVRNPWVYAGLACGVAIAAAPRAAALVMAWSLVAGAALTLAGPAGWFAQASSFALFGAVVGMAAWGLARGHGRRTTVAWLAALMAWCASISIGLASPALAAGALGAALIGGVRPLEPRPVGIRRGPIVAGTLALAVVLGVTWSAARLSHIYRDRPASELTRRLDDALDGGRWLRTNPRTYALMCDLRRAVGLAAGRRYAIVADFPAHWVGSSQPNPLSIDWPQATELHRREVRERVFADLEALRGRGCIIVQRIRAGTVAWQYDTIESDGYYFVVEHVRSRFRKVASTTWFDVYQ